MGQPQIHVLLDEPEMPPTIARALLRLDASVRLSRLDNELAHPTFRSADARLVVTSRANHGDHARFRRLLAHCSDQPCATLVLTPTPAGNQRAVADGDGAAIGFASDLSADELAGRLAAMCFMRRSFERLRREITDLRERDQLQSETASHFGEQMRLASQIQRDLLPRPAPRIAGVTLHILFRPAEHVSGDIYDVTRLDEHHVSLSCADATGHGLPAALLTMLVKRAWQGKQVIEGDYRLLSPSEVLQQLNRELLDANLSQCQFVTGIYAVYDEVARTLSWARGGAPYPILVRSGQQPKQLMSEGPLLGAVQEPVFEDAELTVQSGDVLVFRTDGVDALLATRNGRRIHTDITGTQWFEQLGTSPIAEHLTELAHLLDRTAPDAWPVDDLTVLALEIE